MNRASRLPYAQARLQARHGRRPTDDRWRLLEATADLAGYLQAARSTSLRPWVVHLAGDADPHRIERSLRRDWTAYVSEVAGWVPQAWRPPVRWLATLPYLPFFVHLARGRSAHGWMLDDPVMAGLAQADAERRSEALAASALGPLLDPVRGGTPPVDAWLEAWIVGWPGDAPRDREALERLRRTFRDHIARILDQPLDHPPGPTLRKRIAERLNSSFRREAGRVTAVFAHLGLMILDVERLQGGLVLRALFPDPAERPQWA